MVNSKLIKVSTSSSHWSKMITVMFNIDQSCIKSQFLRIKGQGQKIYIMTSRSDCGVLFNIQFLDDSKHRLQYFIHRFINFSLMSVNSEDL